MFSLDCPHCGGAAVWSKANLFGDGDADRCDACGIPGVVDVTDEGPGHEDENTARFVPESGGRCRQHGCPECGERGT
jgi:predicted RNA-binding Zn-ribbon protein involved in translation (DUF1610 family)